MINQELLNYIKSQLQAGVKPEIIKNSLLKNGWHETAIEEAFKILSNPPLPSPLTSSPTLSVVNLPGGRVLLVNAWKILRQRFWTFVGIAAVPLVFGIIYLVISGVSVFVIAPFFLSENITSAAFFKGWTIPLLVLAYLLLIIPGWIISTWSQIALLYAIKDINQSVGVIECYKKSFRKILSYWWIVFLSGLMTMGALFPLIIPALIFYIWFSLSLFIFINEDVRGLNALIKSREYVRGHWWGLLWRLSFVGIFGALITMIPYFIIEAILKLKYLSAAFIIIVSLILTPLMLVYEFLIYENLRKIKGEFTFSPNKKSKILFTLTGIWGFLFIPLSILALVVLIAINPYAQINKASDAARLSDQSNIRQALEMYYTGNGLYPVSLNQLVPKYIKTVPLDPETKIPYQYEVQEGGKDFKLCIDFWKEMRKCYTSEGEEFREGYVPLPTLDNPETKQ